MQQRQQELLEEKRRQQDQTAQLWDSLGSGRSTPAIRQPSPAVPQDDEDDILAAFSKDAPVNTASHWAPPPSSVPASGAVSGRSTPAVGQPVTNNARAFDDDDDPFGLGEVGKKSNGDVAAPTAPSLANDDDDVLGELSRPVSAKPPAQRASQRRESADEPMLRDDDDMSALPPEPEQDSSAPAKDRALAELLDMGFPADTAKIALAETGGNVQNAVGWLLQQAHEESRQKARGETPSSRERRDPLAGSRSPDQGRREAMPAWMHNQESSRPSSASTQWENTNGEKDAAQVAQEFGSKFLKSANSFWKASQKQMAKTISEFQQDGVQGDPSQPKWMRGANADSTQPPTQPVENPAPRAPATAAGLTDEAAALTAPRDKPQKPPRASAAQQIESPARGRSPAEPLPYRPSSQPKFMQQPQAQPDRRPATKLSRQEVEDQTAQAYVSPARRKRPTPQPSTESKPPEAEVDLFSSAPAVAKPTAPLPSKPARSAPISASAPPPSKPKPPPPRNIPAVSLSALQTSASHRKTGGEHFKRGDYASAHESYTAALTPLPPLHPISIIVLSNRSLTALKTGDAKVAVSDADQALSIIGSSQGTNEIIDLGDGEGTKDMREFYGKALMRKAEALEHMEKYSDAAAVWKQAVEAGVGGNVGLKGRDRCGKAASPKPAAPPSKPASRGPPARAPPPSKSLGNSNQRPTLSSPASAAAVKKLRQANADATKEDDEKFALADSVDAKLAAWRGGKTDNLRALLQSMDLVLWPEAGWKKVGMSDLVMPQKVKIVYMKAIGKVHPDKVSTSTCLYKFFPRPGPRGQECVVYKHEYLRLRRFRKKRRPSNA